MTVTSVKVDDESNPEAPLDETVAAEWSAEEQPNYSWQVAAAGYGTLSSHDLAM